MHTNELGVDDGMPEGSRLYNPDLAPVAAERRTWSLWNIAALWVGMAVCIPTYQLAAGLIAQGMNWKQAVLTILLGNLIVLIPMTLNAHPGTAYGIPFPVLLRCSFGTYGSNIPALMRGGVACGWFGIQTWIGGSAIYSVMTLMGGFDPATKTNIAWLGISPGELGCFALFWVLNVVIIYKGMEAVKWLEVLSAPFLLLVGLALLIWAYRAADGFGPIFAQPDKFETPAQFRVTFAAGLTAMVGFWATLSLNIPDFSRFARSQKDQILGQTIGLPPTMVLYSFIGVAVTSATVVVFGEAIWDPVLLITKFESPILAVVALLALAVATLSTNIAANIVSPANDLSNLAPRWISFRTGGLIAAVIGVVVFRPWVLLADPTGYIFTWLIGYSGLLGPIAGIMIADYFIYRKKQIEVADLYRTHGRYRYCGGFSLVALAALALAVAPNVPGFLVTIKVLEAGSLPGLLAVSYQYTFFTGFAYAFAVYLILRYLAPTK